MKSTPSSLVKNLDGKSDKKFDVQQIAIDAKNYARRQVREGYTAAVFTQKNIDEGKDNKYPHIIIGLEGVRSENKKGEDEAYKIDESAQVSIFSHSLSNIKKYSLGNCSEMALLALDYVIEKTSLIGEIYSIENFLNTQDKLDHVFLVIGRKPGSDSGNPKTWGNDAYICDPWANKVYPANQYLQELEGYVHDAKNKTQYLKIFDINNNYLMPHANYSTHILRRMHDSDYLQEMVEIFNVKMAWITHSLKIFIKDLEILHDKLISIYGKEHPGVKVVANKIDTLNKLIKQPYVFAHGNNYYQVKEELQTIIKSYVNEIKTTLPFSKTEVSVLQKHLAPKKLFFSELKINSVFTGQVSLAIKRINENLAKLSLPPTEIKAMLDEMAVENKEIPKSSAG